VKIGFVGLGKMGYQIVIKLIQDGHELVVYDVDQDAIQKTVLIGAVGATSKQDFIDKLGESPIIWLMIPSKYTTEEIISYSEILPSGATIIDGGNTNYKNTLEHAELLKQKDIELIDIGTSGGVLGLNNGFSLMVGGSKEKYEHISSVLDALVKPNGAHAYIGPTGYGHYVKMIHNGIEYGAMQAMAEGYQLLKEGPLPNISLTTVAEVWQKGSIIQSTLNKLIVEIMQQDENLNGVVGYVADSGEGQWTLETAEKAKINMPSLTVALHVRRVSQQGDMSYATQLLAALRNKFGGHAINKI
jgi:6-phosphogluconate dehydrogenase